MLVHEGTHHEQISAKKSYDGVSEPEAYNEGRLIAKSMGAVPARELPNIDVLLPNMFLPR